MSVVGTIFVSGLVDEYDTDHIGPCYVAGLLSTFDGSLVYVRYLFSDKEITPDSFLHAAALTAMGEVSAFARYEPGYSEYTPAYMSEFGHIGEHDFLELLYPQVRKGNVYAALLISTKPITDLAAALGLDGDDG